MVSSLLSRVKAIVIYVDNNQRISAGEVIGSVYWYSKLDEIWTHHFPSIKSIVIWVNKNNWILYNVTKRKRSAGKAIAAVFCQRLHTGHRGSPNQAVRTYKIIWICRVVQLHELPDFINKSKANLKKHGSITSLWNQNDRQPNLIQFTQKTNNKLERLQFHYFGHVHSAYIYRSLGSHRSLVLWHLNIAETRPDVWTLGTKPDQRPSVLGATRG